MLTVGNDGREMLGFGRAMLGVAGREMLGVAGREMFPPPLGRDICGIDGRDIPPLGIDGRWWGRPAGPR